MLDEFESNMAPPQIQAVAVEELSSLKVKRIIHLIEVLWLDSQIGRDLTTYPSVIQKLKKINVAFFKNYGLPENYGKELAHKLYEKSKSERQLDDDLPF